MSQGFLFALRGDESSKALELDIFSDIDGSFFARYFGGVSADQVRGVLRANRSAKDIFVNMNCRGGDVTEGLSIYEQLVAHPAHVTVRVSALAASIATVIMMAGDVIEIPETGFIMIHGVSGSTRGSADAVSSFADYMRQANETIANVYAARTEQDIKFVTGLMKNGRDNYFNATRAKELGFVDTVVKAKTKSKATAQAFAMLNMAGSDDAPAALLSAIEESRAETETELESRESTAEEFAALLSRIQPKARPKAAPPVAHVPPPPAPAAVAPPTQTQELAASEAQRPAKSGNDDTNEENIMTIPKGITAALSLVDGADEASVLSAISKIRGDLTVASTTAETATVALTKLEAVTGKSGEEAIGVVTAWKTDAEKLPVVNTELAALKGEKDVAELEQILNKGREDKKLSKATADTYREQVQKKELSITALKAVIATLTPIAHLSNTVENESNDGTGKTRGGEGASAGNASGNKGGLLWNAKAYEALTNAERANLAGEDDELFAKMRNDWEKRGCPVIEDAPSK